MNNIVFRHVDSVEHHLNDLSKEVLNQFAIYKNKKLEIDDCSSFDEYYESMRVNKNLIIDYHDILEYDFDEYHYTLILIYLNKKEEKPISYYVSISVEKDLSNHRTLLSLRFDNLEEARKEFLKYKEVFEKKDDVLLLKKIKEKVQSNEWDLY